MVLFGHPPRIIPHFGYRSKSRLHMSARALRNPPPSWDHRGDWAKMRALFSQFASREEPGLPVALSIANMHGQTVRHHSVTDDEGFVYFNIELNDWELPERTRWEKIEFSWINRLGPQSIDGFVLAPGQRARLGVISDIDDTIIETGITGGIRSAARNLKRVLAQMPADREQVPGAATLFGRLAGGSVPHRDHPHAASARPFFYVSSSPWNLFAYLVAFMKSRGLPVGPVHLRDWGFNRETLGSSSHGTHKVGAIERILSFYPEMRFALIGDDTQGDVTAFAQVVRDFPDRIAGIFIRTAGQPLDTDEQAAKAGIESAGIPLWMGASYDVGEDFLKRLGLADDQEAEHIIDTVAKEDLPERA